MVKSKAAVCSALLILSGVLFFQNCSNTSFESASAIDHSMSLGAEEQIPFDGNFEFDDGSFSMDDSANQPAVTYECSVTFQAAGTSKTKVPDRAACEDYLQELQRNNPTKTIVQALFNGQVIYQQTVNRSLCQVTFHTQSTAGIYTNSEAECLSYYDELKRKNPTYTIIKVTLDNKVLYELKGSAATFSCEVSIQNSGVVKSNLSTESQCMSYYNELKKNNPSKVITQVKFNGKVIYKK